MESYPFSLNKAHHVGTYYQTKKNIISLKNINVIDIFVMRVSQNLQELRKIPIDFSVVSIGEENPDVKNTLYRTPQSKKAFIEEGNETDFDDLFSIVIEQDSDINPMRFNMIDTDAYSFGVSEPNFIRPKNKKLWLVFTSTRPELPSEKKFRLAEIAELRTLFYKKQKKEKDLDFPPTPQQEDKLQREILDQVQQPHLRKYLKEKFKEN